MSLLTSSLGVPQTGSQSLHSGNGTGLDVCGVGGSTDSGSSSSEAGSPVTAGRIARGTGWCSVFSRRALYLSLGVIFVHIADIGAGGAAFWVASNCSAGIGGLQKRFHDSHGSGWEHNGDCEICRNGAAMGCIGGSGSAACRFRRSGCTRGFLSRSGKMRDFFDGWGEDLGDGGRCMGVRSSGSAACFF